jgi:hypothetical protein
MSLNGTFVRIGRNIPAVHYVPNAVSNKSGIAILVMHSDADYLSFSAGPELSARGYQVLCANVSDSRLSLDAKIAETGQVMGYLRDQPDVSTVLLLGHSGGGTLLSAFQNIAENGPSAFQGPEKLVACSADLTDLTPADGLLLVDSNWGNGAMRLFSLDPAVMDESSGTLINPDLDLFNPRNGFDPHGSTYSEAFIRTFQRAQGERNNRIIDHALERLAVIESGRGDYADDEPLTVPGAEQGFRNNKLYAQDTRLMSHTREPHTLIRVNGSVTEETVISLRGPENIKTLTDSYWDGALHTTVRTFLDSYAVRTTPDYGYGETTVRGIDWSSSYNCTAGNVSGISVPLLTMGMTAGWEFAASETIYDHATSADKTVAYVEGADHLFRPSLAIKRHGLPAGDTIAHTYDFIDRWISDREPFFD